MKFCKKFLGAVLVASMVLMAVGCDNGTEDPTEDVTTPTADNSGSGSGNNGGGSDPEKKPTISYTISWDVEENGESVKKTYPTDTLDSSIVISSDGKTITLTPEDEGFSYLFTGTFNGQIVNNTKNTEIKLSNFSITNEAGSAILCNKKTVISTVTETSNKIVSNENAAAIYAEDSNIDLGGSGICYVKGTKQHGIKGKGIEVKGSGTWVVQGTTDGSGINCNEFVIKADKTVTLVIANSKNGIKADKYISISSGKIYICSTSAALKTDTKQYNINEETGIGTDPSITLSGGEFYSYENKKWDSTVADKYSVDEGVTVTPLESLDDLPSNITLSN